MVAIVFGDMMKLTLNTCALTNKLLHKQRTTNICYSYVSTGVILKIYAMKFKC
jgi:hypothetical protein